MKPTQADNWGQIGELGVTNSLRNCKACNGEAGDDIRTEKLEVVIRGPFENREEKLEPQEKLPARGLVPEPVKWIIREENLPEPLP